MAHLKRHPQREGAPGLVAEKQEPAQLLERVCKVGGLPVLTACLILEACAGPGQVVEGVRRVPGYFEYREPEEELWRVAARPNLGQKRQLQYRQRAGRGRIWVKARPLTGREAQLPLDVLAHKKFAVEVLSRGDALIMEAMVHIMVDEREAVAITAYRTRRPLDYYDSRIYLASQGYLLEIGFTVDMAQKEALSSDVGQLLDSFRVQLPGPFDPFELGEIPIGPPGRAPRNIYTQPDPKPQQPFRPPEGMPF